MQLFHIRKSLFITNYCTLCKTTAREMYNTKYVNAQQAKIIHSSTNTKRKLSKKNASVWSSKIYRSHQLTPKYMNVKVNGNSKQSQNIKTAAIKYRLNEELNKIVSPVWLVRALFNNASCFVRPG
jgi:protein-arginine kinase